MCERDPPRPERGTARPSAATRPGEKPRAGISAPCLSGRSRLVPGGAKVPSEPHHGDDQRQRSARLSRGHKRPSDRKTEGSGFPFPAGRWWFGQEARRRGGGEPGTAIGDSPGPRGAPPGGGARGGRFRACAPHAGVRGKQRGPKSGPGPPLGRGSPTRSRAGPRLTCNAPVPTRSAAASPPRRRPGPGFPGGRRLPRGPRRGAATDGPRRPGPRRRRAEAGRPPRRP